MIDSSLTRDRSASASGSRRRATAAMLAALLCLAVRWPFLTTTGFVHDQVVFMHWASLAERGGVEAVFGLRPDGKLMCTYPPLYPYVLKMLAVTYRIGAGHAIGPEVIDDVVNLRDTPETAAASALLKMPGVIADALTSALLVLWLSRRVSLRTSAIVSLAYAIMPAVAFNSAVWGQVDSISTLLTLLALESLTRRRWTWVGVLAALAVLTKPQAMLFVPLFGIAAMVADRTSVLAALTRAAAGALIVTIVVIAPIWSARENVARAFFETTALYPLLHLNGFSAWFVANPLPAPRLEELARYYQRDDQALIAGITPRMLGLAALGILAAAVLIRAIRLRASEASIRFAARVLPLAFMVVCTQMHERYLVPAIAFWAWAYERSVGWWLGWLTIGVVAIVNLLWVWQQPLAFETISSLAEWTRSSPGGVSTGVYCAMALLAVLLLSLMGFNRSAASRRLSA